MRSLRYAQLKDEIEAQHGYQLYHQQYLNKMRKKQTKMNFSEVPQLMKHYVCTQTIII